MIKVITIVAISLHMMLTIILIGAILGVNPTCGLFLRSKIPLHKMPAASQDHFEWTLKNGVFRFGMQAPDHWRVETRHPNGTVLVKYTFRTPNGQVIENSFTRGHLAEEGIERDVTGAVTITQDDFPFISSQRANNDRARTLDEMTLLRYGAFSNTYQNDESGEEGILDPEIQGVVISLN